ncbi:MAG TPA: Ig-like domain repeat protein, partial [Chitinophagaceae bacterium]|nr:Ig-like domain repeat protein [Chitinophagaceae bacterium]
MCSVVNTYPPPFKNRHKGIALSNTVKTIIFLLALIALNSATLNAQIATTTTLTSGPNPSCLNEPVTLTATVDQIIATGNVHFWEGPILLGNGTLGIGGTATLILSNLSAGDHTITVVYDGAPPFNGSSSGAIIHTVNSPLAISSQPSGQTVGIGCSASFAVTADGTIPITYQWRKDEIDISGATSATLTIADVTSADDGSYDVIVTNGCGNITSNTASLITEPVLSVSLALKTDVLCFGAATGAINITAAGGVGPYTYAWTGTGVSASAEDQTGLVAGNYSVIVTDVNGCATSALPVTITQPPALSFTSAAVTSPILCNGGTATVTIVATGGTAPISYTFNSQTNTTGVFTGVAAGTNLAYSIADANSCGPLTGTINVTQPPALTFASAAVTTPVTCNGGTATVTIVATGG